jgi:hypothetical protein
MSKVSLKTQNIAPLSLLMLSTLLVAHFVTIGSVDLTVVSSMSSDAGLLGVFGAVCVLLSHLLPAEWKHCLVFFRFIDVLPGHRFIELSKKDARIDGAQLEMVISDHCQSIDSPTKQNQLWYQTIYRPYKGRTEIASVHKSFLLYRDAMVVNLFLLMALGAAQLMTLNLKELIDLTGLISIGLFWLLFTIAAQNVGKRFVTTAVAVFLTEN